MQTLYADIQVIYNPELTLEDVLTAAGTGQQIIRGTHVIDKSTSGLWNIVLYFGIRGRWINVTQNIPSNYQLVTFDQNGKAVLSQPKVEKIYPSSFPIAFARISERNEITMFLVIWNK